MKIFFFKESFSFCKKKVKNRHDFYLSKTTSTYKTTTFQLNFVGNENGIPVSLSLSLTHTHSHTHTLKHSHAHAHTHTHTQTHTHSI